MICAAFGSNSKRLGWKPEKSYSARSAVATKRSASSSVSKRTGAGRLDPPFASGTPSLLDRFQTRESNQPGDRSVLKFIGGTVGVIFLIGLLVVIGLFALIF